MNFINPTKVGKEEKFIKQTGDTKINRTTIVLIVGEFK